MNPLIFILIICSFISGCGNYNQQKTPYTPKQLPGSTDLTFSDIKASVINGCIACHSGRHKAYANYDVVKIAAQEMLQRMESSDPKRVMPPGNPLPPAKIALFRQWVLGGAPLDNKKTEPPRPTPTLGFETIKKEVLAANHCLDCHSQYNDYKIVYKDRVKIVSTINSNSMPFPQKKGLKAEPVADRQKQQLIDWVAQGAPLWPGQTVNKVEQEELKPTWISLRNQVLGPKCILCHNSYGNRGDGIEQSFESYSKLRNWFTLNKTLFIFNKKPGDAPGLFVESILRDPNDPLNIYPPMPYNSPRDELKEDIPTLTPHELEILKQWIELKLPYDDQDLPKEDQ